MRMTGDGDRPSSHFQPASPAPAEKPLPWRLDFDRNFPALRPLFCHRLRFTEQREIPRVGPITRLARLERPTTPGD